MSHYQFLSKREVVVCAVISLLIALVSLWSAPAATALLSGYLLFTALAITIIDYRSFIIPDSLSLPAIPLGMVASVLAVNSDLFQAALANSLIGALVGWLSFYLIRSSYRYLRGIEGLGMGDAKLAAAAGAWVGIDGLPLVLLMATGAAVSAVAARYAVGRREDVTRLTPIPFGSFLAPSLWVIWFFREVLSPV